MRRKDRECNGPEFFDYVLSHAEIMFLAINTGEYPYCIPVNFARQGTIIYIHSALAGRKLELLAQNDKVAFSAAIDVEIDRERATTYYKSVCGTGEAHIVENSQEKQAALDMIGSRYEALCKRPAPVTDAKRVAIIRIDIRELSGKRNLK